MAEDSDRRISINFAKVVDRRDVGEGFKGGVCRWLPEMRLCRQDATGLAMVKLSKDEEFRRYRL